MPKLPFRLALLTAFSTAALAAAVPEVVEGDGARKLQDELKGKAVTLTQINKIFVLKTNDQNAAPPTEITVAAGSYMFIANDETDVVHNVYDVTDQSWVLKKQRPASVAAILFHEPGVHQLRCAIHPQMKITVKVTPAQKP